ncbi:MAG: hypothetical protein AB1750_00640 [Chloroflexota bacterium]
MLAAPQSHIFPYRRQAELPEEHVGLNHLFAAAVVNRKFRQMLLENPEAALQSGYLGERFNLSLEERERLISVRAYSLADLAEKVATS